MTDPKQTDGRKANGAIPGGRPDGATSDADVRRTGEASQRKAGPDGPDATEVGDTFKQSPDQT
jgi:hypothetical protein